MSTQTNRVPLSPYVPGHTLLNSHQAFAQYALLRPQNYSLLRSLDITVDQFFSSKLKYIFHLKSTNNCKKILVLFLIYLLCFHKVFQHWGGEKVDISNSYTITGINKFWVQSDFLLFICQSTYISIYLPTYVLIYLSMCPSISHLGTEK